MDPEPILERLLQFLAQLEPEDLDKTGLQKDLQRLVTSLPAVDLAAISDPAFSFEKATWSDAPAVEEERLRSLRRHNWKIDLAADPEYRIFRREVPLSQTIIAGSQPPWAAGSVPERTIGPLAGRDGRRFWFDLYPIVRLVPLYLEGEQDPALLFYVSNIPKPHKAAGAAGKLLSQFKGGGFELEAGSFWVRADLLAPQASAQSYAGLKIDGGRIRLSQKPKNVLGKLIIPAGATCSLSLQLSGHSASRGSGQRPSGSAGLQTPERFAFHFSKTEQEIDAVGEAHWKLFGQQIPFEWDQKSKPFYNDVLKGVIIPLQAGARGFSVRESHLQFARAEGGAAIVQSAWVLPVAAIDIQQPTAAGGNGGLAILGNSDLTLTWRGLRDGPIFLPQPWIVQFPNLLLIIDLQAGNLHARQRFLLWQDEDSAYRSSVEVKYTDSFPLIYAANDQGAELVLAQVNAEAKLDRPIDAAGNALDIRSKKSVLALSFTQALKLVYLYDDNILADNLEPGLPLPAQFPESIALAMRNSLFTATPVNGFLLFAELLDEEMIAKGNILLLFGLFGLLPTLPDPYAANVGVFRRFATVRKGQGHITMLLLSHIRWRKAGGDAPDGVQTNFHLLPFAGVGVAMLAHSANQRLPAIFGDPRCEDKEEARNDCSETDERMERCNDYEWDCLFGRFNHEQYTLLDVSTNADWMGVSLGWFDPDRVRDEHLIFYQIYGAQQNGEQSQSLFPLQVRGLDVTAQGRFVRAVALPQNSWEPLFNLSAHSVDGDPYPGLNLYRNDGGPTRLFNDNLERVPVTPLSKVEELLAYFNGPTPGFTGALFTLPFGLRAFAEINKNHPDVDDDAGLRLNREAFREGTLTGALQIQVNAPKREDESPMFIGGTLQLTNLHSMTSPLPAQNTLGGSVATIFNNEFFEGTNGYGNRGVPLTRIDFSGYGSSTFSRWENPGAAFAQTSQTRFDIFIGRTAHEVIQVKSIIYPWGIRVVRTIVIFRSGSSYIYRFDTGWQAESDGLYDFGYFYREGQGLPKKKEPNPYEIHPGVVKGVFNVRNIVETTEFPKFAPTVQMVAGDYYIDDGGYRQQYAGSTSEELSLQPVYFDADVKIEYLKGGGAGDKTPSKGILGYVQLKPKGLPIPTRSFRDLLREQFGSIGGPVDCLIDIGNTGQQMRVTRVDVSESIDAANVTPQFVGTARGSVVLPKDGSWSVVQYNHGSGEVSPLADNAAVPLIRKGLLDNVIGAPLRLDHPMEMLRAPQNASQFFGLLQSTGTQKALFRNPHFEQDLQELLSDVPDFADAYRMLNSAGIFPNLDDTFPVNLGAFKTTIIEEGYKLLDEADPTAILEQALPDGPWYIIDEDFLKLYVEYDKRDKDGQKEEDGKIKFGIDSAAEDMGKRWLSKLNDITMVVDLGPLTRLMMVKGKFDAEKGAAPSFIDPQLEFSDALQPVIDLLEILMMLQGDDYAGALAKGLEIAMSNSADSWAYAFHARKEIPLIRFPPPAMDNPTAPLKLECSLGVGVYFNEVFSLTGNANQLIPSAGAFLAFYGRLSVMCVSVAVGTVYATGSVELRMSADIKTGPSLLMKFGFGAEVNVGLPVIGNVSLLYMVGIEIVLDSSKISTAAFLLFRGRAEILGGIVTVTITIEAKGTITRQANVTDMTAQVTFGLDISIFLVINISFSESWQESRQIA